METISIKAEERTDLGPKAARKARRDGLVPCVLYGAGETVHFTAPTGAFKNLIYTPNFHTVDVEVAGKTHRAILKESQFHPVTDNIVHLDFLALVDDKKVTVNLPIRFTGQAAGVKEGGKLMPALRTLSVKAFPKDLKSEIAIDVTEVELGKSIKVKEIELENMEIMNNPQIPIASVEIPRALKSAESEAEAAAGEGAEGAEGDAPAAEGDAKEGDDKK